MARAQPSKGFLRSPFVVVSQAGIQQGHELVHGNAPPVAMVEELVLQPAEEALHRGVVWRAALPGHRADDAVALAYRDPSGPSVVDAPVGMEDRGFPVAFLGAGGHQAPVGEFGARPRPYRPGDELAIEAVEHRREVALAAGQPELGDVSEPYPVRSLGMEAAPDQVGRSVRDLPGVRAVPFGSLEVDDPASLLGHDPPHDLLGHDHGVVAGAERMGDVAVAPGAVRAIERIHDAASDAGVLVVARKGAALVLI